MKYTYLLIFFCTGLMHAAEPGHSREPISSTAQDIRSLMFKMANLKSLEMRGAGNSSEHRRSCERIKAELEKIKISKDIK